MIDKLSNDVGLFPFLCNDCSDSGIGVEFSDELVDMGMLRADRIVVIKSDGYFNSLGYRETLPSVDNLVLVRLSGGDHDLYLIEFKNVSSTRDLGCKDIIPKFETTINYFLYKDFKEIFCSDDANYNKFRLWLITNPFRCVDDDTYRRKMLGTVLERYTLMKPLEFMGKYAYIEPYRPNRVVSYS